MDITIIDIYFARDEAESREIARLMNLTELALKFDGSNGNVRMYYQNPMLPRGLGEQVRHMIDGIVLALRNPAR